jgi:hypothetical protein
MTLFVELIREHGTTLQLCQDLLLLLANSAIKLKGPFLTQEGLPAMVLCLISDDQVQPRQRVQAS